MFTEFTEWLLLCNHGKLLHAPLRHRLRVGITRCDSKPHTVASPVATRDHTNRTSRDHGCESGCDSKPDHDKPKPQLRVPLRLVTSFGCDSKSQHQYDSKLPSLRPETSGLDSRPLLHVHFVIGPAHYYEPNWLGWTLGLCLLCNCLRWYLYDDEYLYNLL